jgi:hypothetical protein
MLTKMLPDAFHIGAASGDKNGETFHIDKIKLK